MGRAAENAISSYHANRSSFPAASPQAGSYRFQRAGIVSELMIQHAESCIPVRLYKFDKVGYIATARLADISRLISDTPCLRDGRRSQKRSQGYLPKLLTGSFYISRFPSWR